MCLFTFLKITQRSLCLRLAPHPTHTQKKRKAPKRKFAFLFGALVVLGVLHHLRHETAHGLGGFVLLLPGGVGVGAQSKARVVVAQHTADGFHVYAILQGQRSECVSEIVKAYVRQARVLQNFLMQVHDRVGVVHLSRDG